MTGPPHIPEHLRQYVVEQDYGQYTEQDQAVWRFVLLQLASRLRNTAHSAYAGGLAATGISVERIPSIEEMNDRLSEFGWGAASVDGFIPPRAFQEFQALGILAIASDIRTVGHLAYTPAPDIIHEAAGHAPILSDPDYARYLKRIGEVGQKAFSTPADRAVYTAIHALSEEKERPSATVEQIDAAERALAAAARDVGPPSEAAKVARLYWWTAEYGLVGTPNDYRLYGAGLLSSLGESHTCHDARVRKIPLTSSCIEVDYDITRAQPQLFVARDFEHLLEVLEDVSRGLAYRIGGDTALRLATESREVATVTLDTGLGVVGVLSRVRRNDAGPYLLEFSGRTALERDGRLLSDCVPPAEYALPIGVLEDGTPLSALTLDVLVGRYVDRAHNIDLRLRSGTRFRGHLSGTRQHRGRLTVLLLSDFEIAAPDGSFYRTRPPVALALGHRVETACAGAPPGYFPSTAFSGTRVPKPRWFSAAERELIELYEQAVVAWQGLSGVERVEAFTALDRELDARFPDNWLLKWNLLESLVKRGEGPELCHKLESDLERLELAHAGREPIATGLAYVRSIRDSVSTSGASV